ncbi:MAG TPA: hypothetical protein VN253_10660 [Kofleriaceae bacterium]|nr:hypothetical protein [Kofleriaceae bacterium]
MDRRQQLLGWIEATKQTQRRLAIVLIALIPLSAGLAAWSKPVGVFAFIGVGALAVCGFWVTAAHNAAHRQKLAELDRAPGPAPRRP